MTIRSYCDAAYAIILEEKQRLGTSLEEAIEELQEWAVGVFRSREEREEEQTARANERELQRLQAMLGGIGA